MELQTERSISKSKNYDKMKEINNIKIISLHEPRSIILEAANNKN